jgi:hypothetical protein
VRPICTYVHMYDIGLQYVHTYDIGLQTEDLYRTYVHIGHNWTSLVTLMARFGLG